MNTKEHLTAVIVALEAWRDSLPAPAPAVVAPAALPEPKPKPKRAAVKRPPKKTEAQEAAEIAAAAERLRDFRYDMDKNVFLHVGRKRKARITEINNAAGRKSMALSKWRGRYSPAQWVACYQKATRAEVQMCGGRHE